MSSMFEKTGSLFDEPESPDLLGSFLELNEQIFVKKLSVNDRDWSNYKNKHQAGVYIPHQDRDSGFFPSLMVRDGRPDGSAEIRETLVEIFWPQVGEVLQCRLVHYLSKGQETHLTRLPKAVFSPLLPASFLLIGLDSRTGKYSAITLNSDDDSVEQLYDLLSIPPDFVSGVFHMLLIRKKRKERVVLFVDELVKSFVDGKIVELSLKYGKLPETVELARLAREKYLTDHGLKNLNPFEISNPGDAVREISRGVEFEIFKDLQLRNRAVELVRLVLGDDPKAFSLEKTLRSLVSEFGRIDALMMSAAQQRKSRAGYSFEHHIEAMMLDGGIPFEKQVVLKAKKRPDFILPTRSLYETVSRGFKDALVLSAKTTLRERWKQVGKEINNCDLYLATVDENIARNAIEDMASQGIFLVVPEGLKKSKFTEYEDQASVLTFSDFFSAELKKARWPIWSALGLV